MDDVQKRRYQLLKEARMTYRDQDSMPAVHPRYRAAYKSLYPEEGMEPLPGGGTFAVRAVLCLLLFALFVMADYKNVSLGKINSTKVVQQIRTEPEAVSVFLEKLPGGGFLDK